jgi:hypothetical protein
MLKDFSLKKGLKKAIKTLFIRLKASVASYYFAKKKVGLIRILAYNNHTLLGYKD